MHGLSLADPALRSLQCYVPFVPLPTYILPISVRINWGDCIQWQPRICSCPSCSLRYSMENSRSRESRAARGNLEPTIEDVRCHWPSVSVASPAPAPCHFADPRRAPRCLYSSSLYSLVAHSTTVATPTLGTSQRGQALPSGAKVKVPGKKESYAGAAVTRKQRSHPRICVRPWTRCLPAWGEPGGGAAAPALLGAHGLTHWASATSLAAPSPNTGVAGGVRPLPDEPGAVSTLNRVEIRCHGHRAGPSSGLGDSVAQYQTAGQAERRPSASSPALGTSSPPRTVQPAMAPSSSPAACFLNDFSGPRSPQARTTRSRPLSLGSTSWNSAA